MKKTIFEIILVLIGVVTVISLIVWKIIDIRQSNEIVATYESTLDNIQVDYDDENHNYDVWVDNTHYRVAEDDIKTLPYYKNEVVVEITRNGKCKLYFFIKWGAE